MSPRKDAPKVQRVYVRRQARALGAERQGAMDDFYPHIALDKADMTEKGDLDPGTLFEVPPEAIWMEIGFGSGEHLAAELRKFPERGFIGAEPFVNGVANLVKDLATDRPRNVRLFMDDALFVVRSLTPASLDGLYILNPDPWHKRRHNKRRIVREETLDDYARVLKPGAFLIMSTDVNDMADWMVTKSFNHPAFEWTAEGAADWRIPPEGWTHTKYEQKGKAAGRIETYLIFRRRV